jgi:DNA-binding MarR family transcriptional regulator/GNAT superfamily N-acetyltransferase
LCSENYPYICVSTYVFSFIIKNKRLAMNFYEQLGKKALGSRLRQISEMMTSEAAQIYAHYGSDFQPRWLPIYVVLCENDALSVTEISQIVGQSHASISQIVKEMKKKSYVSDAKCVDDGRKNLISLTESGKALKPQIDAQLTDCDAAVEQIFSGMSYDLWKALSEFEYSLQQKNLYDRVIEQCKIRESVEVTIIDYTPQYANDFRNLNHEWITKYFKLEAADNIALDNPQSYILDKGGRIFVAIYKEEPVGVVALLKMADGGYELGKMAVSPKAQGKSIGYLLGKHAIEVAKELKAHRVFLESNTILKPAISLYNKLGFKKIIGGQSPYERANIQMELTL